MKKIIINNINGTSDIIPNITDVNISGNYLIVTIKEIQSNDEEKILLHKKTKIFKLDMISNYTITIETTRFKNEYND